jgi:ribA/ribD-fused uncharacterized protein
MMWRKAMLFGDNEIAEECLREVNPGRVKALGRRVRNFEQAKWDAAAKACVRDGVLLKFSQNESIKQVLLATGDKLLVEASPNDAIWGIGLAADVAERTPREQWGTNWLGQVLMEVREILRKAANGDDDDDDDDADTDAVPDSQQTQEITETQ